MNLSRAVTALPALIMGAAALTGLIWWIRHRHEDE
jgi:hypothetical protein